MDYMTSGQLIRFFRERIDFTQEELAEAVGVSVVKLSHWENDETVPRIGYVGALSGALGLSPEEEKKLDAAASAAREWRKLIADQEAAEQRAVENAYREESERQSHKRKAIGLFVLGCCGFVAGFIVAVLLDGLKENWYVPFAFGAVVSGTPFGYSLIYKKLIHRCTYTRRITHFEWLLELVIKFFVFLLSFYVGVFGAPIAFFYHSYEASRKGSVLRVVLLVLLIVIVLATISIVFPLLFGAFGNG